MDQKYTVEYRRNRFVVYDPKGGKVDDYGTPKEANEIADKLNNNLLKTNENE